MAPSCGVVVADAVAVSGGRESGVIGLEGRGDAPFGEHDPMRRGKMIEVSWLRIH